MATGWVENKDKGTKYYFDKTSGAMYTGIQTIDGVKYEFSSAGICLGEKKMNRLQVPIQVPRPLRTICLAHCSLLEKPFMYGAAAGMIPQEKV
ncbi:MAG: hypothetical protein V8Q93_13005 [Blautia faecis]